jgi:hypothetical protein
MWQRLPTMCRAGSWTGERAVWWWHEVEVLATSATFQGELFSSVVSRHASGIEVLAAACPQWVDLVETGTVTGPDAEREVVKVIDPAPAVAAQTARVAPDPDGTAGLTLAASGDAGEFSRLAAALASRREPVIPFAP